MTTDVTISQTILTAEIVQPDGPSVVISVPAGPQIVVSPVGIQGPQGDVGPQGDTGLQGIQGIQGIQGEQGPQGVQGEQGPQGESWAETFETVAQGLKSYAYSIGRFDGSVSTIVYDLGSGLSITKTLGRVGGVLTTITLSGDTPAGIDLVKTLARDVDGNVIGASYGST